MPSLTCAECECQSGPTAERWEGHLADLDDDGEDEVAFFCPACVAREFA